MELTSRNMGDTVMELKQRWTCREFLFTSNLFMCLCLSLLICQSIRAEPDDLSPAGGGYLQLDDKHDFVSTAGEWFPDEQFMELTVEAWLYLEEAPDFGTFWSVVGQGSRFNLDVGPAYSLGLFVEASDAPCTGFVQGPMPTDEWVHVVILCNAGAGGGFNGAAEFCGPFAGNLRASDAHFRIGGVIPEQRKTRFGGVNVSLQGYIDEVRISSVLRTPPFVAGQFNYELPEERFEIDEATISLWHFDEGSKAKGFEDSSGNGYHLWRSGKRGKEAFAVQPQDKLSVTWGQLKQ